jgi:hypothetical protein
MPFPRAVSMSRCAISTCDGVTPSRASRAMDDDVAGMDRTPPARSGSITPAATRPACS